MANENVTNNVTTKRRDVYPSLLLGKGAYGDLVMLPTGNTFMLTRSGHGGATFLNGFLTNIILFNNPKEVCLWVVNDYAAGQLLVPEFAKLPNSKGVMQEYVNSGNEFDLTDHSVDCIISNIDKFYTNIVSKKAALDTFVASNGFEALSEEDKIFYNRYDILIVNCFNTDSDGMTEVMKSLERVLRVYMPGSRFSVILTHGNWAPDAPYKWLFHNFITTWCPRELSEKILGCDLGSSVAKTGEMLFRRAGHIDVTSFISQYRPDSFIKKVVKAFRVKD